MLSLALSYGFPVSVGVSYHAPRATPVSMLCLAWVAAFIVAYGAVVAVWFRGEVSVWKAYASAALIVSVLLGIGAWFSETSWPVAWIMGSVLALLFAGRALFTVHVLVCLALTVCVSYGWFYVVLDSLGVASDSLGSKAFLAAFVLVLLGLPVAIAAALLLSGRLREASYAALFALILYVLIRAAPAASWMLVAPFALACFVYGALALVRFYEAKLRKSPYLYPLMLPLIIVAKLALAAVPKLKRVAGC